MQRLADLADIPPRGLVFAYPDGPFEEQGILLRLPSGEVRAYKNQCRHLSVRLDDHAAGELWDAEGTSLCCSSHGARYRPSDGLCTAGPCRGSHLRSLPVEVRNGSVWLDTSKLGGFFSV